MTIVMCKAMTIWRQDCIQWKRRVVSHPFICEGL